MAKRIKFDAERFIEPLLDERAQQRRSEIIEQLLPSSDDSFDCNWEHKLSALVCEATGLQPDVFSRMSEREQVPFLELTLAESEQVPAGGVDPPADGPPDELREWIASRLKGGQKKLAQTIVDDVTSIDALNELGLLGVSKREYPSAKYQGCIRHLNTKLREDQKPWKFAAKDNEAVIVDFDWNSESSVNTR